jgi:hypothetical protein
MKRYLAILALLPLLAMGGRQQGMGPGPGMPASAGGGGYSDNFPGSSLSGNWSSYIASGWGAPAVSSSQVHNAAVSPGNASLIGYTAGTFGANQFSQATEGSLTNAGLIENGSPCIHVTPSSGNGYCWFSNSSGGITKITAGVTSNLTTSGSCSGVGVTPAIGDVLNISNAGPTITVNDVTQSKTCTATDSTYTGGYAGLIMSLGTQYSVVNSFASWTGN